MPQNNTILVTGGTGNLGRAVVTALSEQGFDVVVGTTDPAKVSAGPGKAIRKVDFLDEPSLDEAVQGIDGLFLIAPPMDSEAAAKLNPVIEKAQRRKVAHIVLNSALGVDLSDQAPLNNVERHLKASGVNYTILRPNFFMENFSSGFIAPMIAQGGIFLAAGDGKTSFVSTKDIARTAAVVFKEKHFGREYNLTGADLMDHYQVAALITEASRKKIAYHAISSAEMCRSARESGLPEGSVQMLDVLYAAVREGHMAITTADIEAVTGSAPITFKEFAKANQSAWE